MELHRPLVEENQGEPLCFMQTDIDYYTVRRGTVDEPVLRVFGVTSAGNSVMVHVTDFEPYFWFKCGPNKDTDYYCNCLKEKLSTVVPVRRIEIHQKEDIMCYKQGGLSPYYKIFTYSPKAVSQLRSTLEKGIKVDNIMFQGTTYESNIPFALRFMIDKGIVGMCWLELAEFRESQKVSRAQIEATTAHWNIVVHPPEGEWSMIPPLRILSFDIETNNDGENFPVPEKNEVVQIGNVFANPDGSLEKHIFVLGGCAEIVDTYIHSYSTESKMLMAWHDFVIQYDPDIITGYNIMNFDYSYLFKRAEHLNLRGFPYFGRIIQAQTRIKDTTFQSKAQGLRETKDVHMEGRIQLDMFQHIQREHKLSKYSLNSVSLHFLKEQKEDVHWTLMKQLQAESNETRRRIAVYCIKDCYLPLRLLDKLMCIYNYAEMARVTGVPFTYLLTRGQQIKVASQLLRKAQTFHMLMPTIPKTDVGDQYQGAFVLEPNKGFHNSPIATLDFASLYPSIMMAHNLCYCTLLHPTVSARMDPSLYIETPSGERFVRQDVRKGLLPLILEELISTRKRAREELSRTSDPFMQKVLDGRQLALKISANSVYGFTGAQVGQLPCLAISSTVTAYGREMIEFTKRRIETHYNVDNGYEYDSEVIYGDTDSVMIKFGENDLAKVMELGKEAALLVSKDFINPIKLEFEKVYFPYLLLSKKKYAGLLWTNPIAHDKIDMKGLESVRRDNCALARNTINEVLQKLLIERDVNAAVDYVKKTVSALLQNKIDLSLLVITKALGKKTTGKSKNVYTAKQAHVQLAQKMQQRDASSTYNVGDRVAYVMIKGVKGQKAYELAEDPIFALQNNLPIDYDYYLQKQLKQPLNRVFEAILDNTNVLFHGEHTRIRFQPKSEGGALSKFVTVKSHCLSCNAPTKDSKPLCPHCFQRAPEVYLKKTLETNQIERNCQELWAECQRCQGSVLEEVLCTNSDCPIFYRREKVKKDMGAMKKVLDKLERVWINPKTN